MRQQLEKILERQQGRPGALLWCGVEIPPEVGGEFESHGPFPNPGVAAAMALGLEQGGAHATLMLPDSRSLGIALDQLDSLEAGERRQPDLRAVWQHPDERLPGPSLLPLWVGGEPPAGPPVAFLEPAYLGREVAPSGREVRSLHGGIAREWYPAQDAVLICHRGSVEAALELRAELGDGLGVLELCRVWPLVLSPVLDALRNCGRAVFVQAGQGDAQLAQSLCAELADTAFEWLDAPPIRVSATDPEEARRRLVELMSY